MERTATNRLKQWQISRNRKPLVIEGARQVGKTWLVKEFGKRCYSKVAYVNFESQKYLQSLFEQNFDTQRIITTINAATGVTCTAGDTLIFLDEIQAAPGGITSLKYFCEEAPEYHVIAAGSLLGIELHGGESFPVGKVQFMQMFPMDFNEFLQALGEGNLAALIASADWTAISMFETKLHELLKYYYFVGGMPEAVLSFSQYRDWNGVREIQDAILKSYVRDMSKHAPHEVVPRITDVWNSIPAQLSKENRKFVYGALRQGARAREYEIALQWLKDAGLIYIVHNVSAPRVPLKSYENRAAFKIYALDVGLLAAMAGLKQHTLVSGNEVFTEFKGALTEQYVFQQLHPSHDLYYYSKANSTLEIDFLLQDENDCIVPFEVKAETNVKAKSLRMFVTEQKSTTAYRMSMNPYRKEDWLVNMPLYAVANM